MAAIVTSNMRIYAAEQFIDGFSDTLEKLYLTIGRVLPWTDDNTPPSPVDCEFDQSAVFRDMLSAKLISSSDVSLVIPRYDWSLGTDDTGLVYSQYVNNIDLFDPNSGLPPFYVITDELNVYKCLSNGGGVKSTVKPTGTVTTPIINADGYVWKYMYTVPSANVLKFVTNEWIPVQTLTSNDGSNQWLVQAAAVPGTIDRIDVITHGSQYTVVPTVQIVGDGTGAQGTAVISGGNVTSVIVNTVGSGYTWANIVFSGGGVGANGATANAVISPFAGHGADPVKELGGFYVLVNSKLTYDENGTFTVSNDYRQVSVLQNPMLKDGVTSATALDYDLMTRLTFGSVTGTTFVQDETVTGSVSGATGVVVDYDSEGKVLRLSKVFGSFVPAESVVGASATGILQTYTGTAASGSNSTVVLRSDASASDGAYTNMYVKIMSGPGANQIAIISNYVGQTRTATIRQIYPTVSSTWTVNPTSSSTVSVANIVLSDFEPFSGNIVYMENRRPIARAQDQVEDIKIVVEF